MIRRKPSKTISKPPITQHTHHQLKSALLVGDCREVLPRLPAQSVQCGFTSPPYFGLRDYGVGGIGHEARVEQYVANLVAVFHEVWRVLKDDGVLWINLGETWRSKRMLAVPYRVALALEKDGWLLRDVIIWHKPGATPASVQDRCSRDYEPVLLLAKRHRYFFNIDALREPHTDKSLERAAYELRRSRDCGIKSQNRQGRIKANTVRLNPKGRTPGALWSIAPANFPGQHFAVMPLALAMRCILASTRPGDVVLDPFGGSGTTAVAAQSIGRRSVLIEANPTYVALTKRRLAEPIPQRKTTAPKPTTTARRVQRAARITTLGNLPGSARERAAKAGISESTQRTLDRLARERPDLLELVQAGRLSTHRAAIEAGHVRRRGAMTAAEVA